MTNPPKKKKKRSPKLNFSKETFDLIDKAEQAQGVQCELKGHVYQDKESKFCLRCGATPRS